MLTRTALKNLAEETANNHWIGWKPLRRCRAEYLELDNCTILRSYWTIVAIYNPKNSTVYAFDNYSATTCQHIRKFAQDMRAMRTTKLYKDSTGCIEVAHSKYANTHKLNAKEWRDVIARDFEGYITSNWT